MYLAVNTLEKPTMLVKTYVKESSSSKFRRVSTFLDHQRSSAVIVNNEKLNLTEELITLTLKLIANTEFHNVFWTEFFKTVPGNISLCCQTIAIYIFLFFFTFIADR